MPWRHRRRSVTDTGQRQESKFENTTHGKLSVAMAQSNLTQIRPASALSRCGIGRLLCEAGRAVSGPGGL